MNLCFAVACGPTHSDNPPVPSANRVPDYLSSLPDLQTVASDSLAIAALRPVPGPGPILLSLDSGDYVSIEYTTLSFASSDVVIHPYKEPLLLQPPVTLTARGNRDNAVGQEYAFAFSGSDQYGGAISAVATPRLPKTVRTTAVTWQNATTQGPFPADDAALEQFELDGEPEADDQKSRRYLVDARYDVPAAVPHIDISWVNIGEVADGVRMAMQLATPPQLGEFTAYGFEIGTSGIDTATFGSGATYMYKVEWRKSGLRIEDREAKSEPRLVDNAKVKIGSLVEIFVSYEELPRLKDQRHLVVRPFALDWGFGISVIDRLEPAFLRSPFAVLRSQTQLPGDRTFAVDMHVAPELATSPLVDDYFRLIPAVAKDLEALSGIPLYRTGAFPLFYVPVEERGYSGLNTTDRGTLTTLGLGTSLVAKTQLMAHEIAHLLNARSSQLTERWLQEAHSEWIAERVLLRSFSTRTVYKFLRDLRYDRFFDLTAEGDEFPLDTWSTESSSYGYEKAFLFLNLLEQQVGTDALLTMFQSAVNVPIDSVLFQQELERLTGRDLSDVFAGWVYAGDKHPDFEPNQWFGDTDADGLLDIDERLLGTDPEHPDTDRDGFADGEEYFDARSPLQIENPMSTDLTVRVVGTSNARTNDLLRMQSQVDQQIEYSPAIGSGTWRDAGLPVFIFPPWQIEARTVGHGGDGTVLSRGLFVNSEEIATPLLAELLYPSAVLSAISTDGDISATFIPSLGDSQADLPTDFASFNIKTWRAAWSADSLQVMIDFDDDFDSNDFRGEITLAWDRIEWAETGPNSSRAYTLLYTNGTPYWSDGSDQPASVLPAGFAHENKTLTLTLPKEQLVAWSNGVGDKNICLWTTAFLDGGQSLSDHGGCIILEALGFSRYQARISDHFAAMPGSPHLVDLFLDTEDDTGTRAALIRDVAATAIRRFEKILARPIWERQHWPVHAFVLSSGSTIGSARQLAGAYLAGRDHLLDEIYLYLIIEELGRLHATDLLARHVDPPYWILELYVQWLTAGSAYQILPTANVKNFHHARVDQYSCYVNQAPGCEDIYNGDIPLQQWTAETASATGSVKSLMFLLVLNATIGTESLGEIFSGFTNHMPTSSELLAMLQTSAPDQAALLSDLWRNWVDGSGSLAADQVAILGQFVDQDNDGLYLVEEQIRGSSDTTPDIYP